MTQPATTLETADIAAILKALPHRYPFLMVDRIIEMRGDEAAIGIKNVTVNEPQFLGHFPGNPIIPGALLLAEILDRIRRANAAPGRPVVVRFAKFLRPVRPGGHGLAWEQLEAGRHDRLPREKDRPEKEHVVVSG